MLTEFLCTTCVFNVSYAADEPSQISLAISSVTSTVSNVLERIARSINVETKGYRIFNYSYIRKIGKFNWKYWK